MEVSHGYLRPALQRMVRPGREIRDYGGALPPRASPPLRGKMAQLGYSGLDGSSLEYSGPAAEVLWYWREGAWRRMGHLRPLARTIMWAATALVRGSFGQNLSSGEDSQASIRLSVLAACTHFAYQVPSGTSAKIC